jgi:hypothetical protein
MKSQGLHCSALPTQIAPPELDLQHFETLIQFNALLSIAFPFPLSFPRERRDRRRWNGAQPPSAASSRFGCPRHFCQSPALLPERQKPILESHPPSSDTRPRVFPWAFEIKTARARFPPSQSSQTRRGWALEGGRRERAIAFSEGIRVSVRPFFRPAGGAIRPESDSREPEREREPDSTISRPIRNPPHRWIEGNADCEGRPCESPPSPIEGWKGVSAEEARNR